MEPFRILEHPADIGFEAYGATLEEVFAHSAQALMSLVIDLATIRPTTQVPIRVEGPDLPGLLVNWLSEILYLQDGEGWLLRDFEMKSVRSQEVSAVARGERFERGRHQLKLLVKAVTYHQLKLEQTAAGWRAQVYVDV
jgi:SHS2 domain-containing protein